MVFFFAEVWKSVRNLIDKDSTVYLNNISRKKLLGVDVTGNVETHNNFTLSLDYLSLNNLGNVETYNKLTLSLNNLWNKGKVDCNGFFTLTSVTAQKNLIVKSAKKLDLVDKGMWLVVL